MLVKLQAVQLKTRFDHVARRYIERSASAYIDRLGGSTGGHEHVHDVNMSSGGCRMKGRPAVVIANVDFRSESEKQTSAFDRAGEAAEMKKSYALPICSLQSKLVVSIVLSSLTFSSVCVDENIEELVEIAALR